MVGAVTGSIVVSGLIFGMMGFLVGRRSILKHAEVDSIRSYKQSPKRVGSCSLHFHLMLQQSSVLETFLSIVKWFGS